MTDGNEMSAGAYEPYDFANRRHDGSVLFLLHLGVPLIDPVQLNLIETEIARRGRFVSVAIRSEIDMGFAGHDHVQPVIRMCNGKPVRRIQARVRRDERPEANARV